MGSESPDRGAVGGVRTATVCSGAQRLWAKESQRAFLGALNTQSEKDGICFEFASADWLNDRPIRAYDCMGERTKPAREVWRRPGTMADVPQSLTPVSERRSAKTLVLGVASICVGVAVVVA